MAPPLLIKNSKLINKPKEKKVQLKQKHTISTKFRFSDHRKKNTKFGAAVFSRSDSPYYILSITSDKHNTTPISIIDNQGSGGVIAETPEKTPMYPRVVAITGSGNRQLVVFSPTKPISPNMADKKPSTLEFGSVKRALELEFDSVKENILVQEYTFQCGSHNKSYSPKREKSQNQVMGQSAKEALRQALLKKPEIRPNSTSEESEWCHLAAHRNSQFALSACSSQKEFVPQSQNNLTASTKQLNSKMIVLEETASFLLKNLPSSFSLTVSSACPIISGSNNVMIKHMVQKIAILYKNQVVLTLKQNIKYDFGLNPEDSKQLAAMKDVYSLIAFSINSLTEKLGANVLQQPSYKSKKSK